MINKPTAVRPAVINHDSVVESVLSNRGDAMIEVRIRANDETSDQARYLTDWKIDDLERLTTQIRRWGVNTQGDEYRGVTGVFVMIDTAAFFEIVVDVE